MKDNSTLSAEERALARERERAEHVLDSPQHKMVVGVSRAGSRIQRLKPAISRPRSRSAGRTEYPRSAKSSQPALREYARRAVVKITFTANKKQGLWSAHARYLEREGAQAEGQRGVGFDSQSDAVDTVRTLGEWQSAGDRQLFKVVLSPEDGQQLDLVAYTRRVMADVAVTEGRPLEWVAIEHYNTAHPHVHVCMRGNARLRKELMRSEFRGIAADQATQMLGYKSEKEKQQELDMDIGAARWTKLDQLIKKDLTTTPEGGLSFAVTGLSRASIVPEAVKRDRARRIGRMSELEKMGLAHKAGALTWAVQPEWETALKQMEVIRTRTKTLAAGRELMTDPRCIPVVTNLSAGQSLIGRVLGTGVDDATGKSYLLVEGHDSKAHFVTMSAERYDVKPGTLVRLSGTKAGQCTVREYDLIIPARGFERAMREAEPVLAQVCDDDAVGRVGQNAALPAGGVGFPAQIRRRMHAAIDRGLELDKKRAKDGGVGI